MSLKDLHPLKVSYLTGTDDLAADFYVPCMERATRYDRAVGYFSSGIYAVCLAALRGFVERDGTMRIVCSHNVSKGDKEAFEEGVAAHGEEEVQQQFQKELETLLAQPDTQDQTRVLACLVARKIVEFRIAYIGDDPDAEIREYLMHAKIGFFEDAQGNVINFTSSSNESVAAFSRDKNLEVVNPFANWDDENKNDQKRVEIHREFFDRLWSDNYPNTKVRKLPEVIEKKLFQINEDMSNDDLLRAMGRLPSTSGSTSKASSSRSLPDYFGKKNKHQVEALKSWNEREERGILQHPTGCGKTFTALLAIQQRFERLEVPLVVVPSQILLDQWFAEIKKAFGNDVEVLLCNSENTRWKKPDVLRGHTSFGKQKRLVLATVDTASSEIFMERICSGPSLFMVADEVHTLGSATRRQLLELETGSRLGLSATPDRAGDGEGTSALRRYFGDNLNPEMTLQDAIKANLLCSYYYFPDIVQLNDDEQAEWKRLTTQIRKKVAWLKGADGELPQSVEILFHERARILKQAASKPKLAAQICIKNFKNGQKWLVYSDSAEQNSQVRFEVDALADEKRRDIQTYEYHSAMHGDREETMGMWNQTGGILFAIKCLDEGVDIPSADHALILASSQNPREFIQRRGRVLRKAKDKTLATIFDVLTVPQPGDYDSAMKAWAYAELARAEEFAKSAENNQTATTMLTAELVSLGVLDPSDIKQDGVEFDENERSES